MIDPIHLLVLAGGFGTRLRSAVSDVPKPLAPVANHPYLYYLLENWIAQGISQFTFLLHHQASLAQDFLVEQQGSGLLKNCEVGCLVESQPLGTGGAVAYAVQQLKLEESFLVANADTWLGSGVEQIVIEHAPAISVIQASNVERYGSVEINNGRVIEFKEKQHSSGAGWINAGLYKLSSELFQNWDGQAFSLEQDFFPKLVKVNELAAVSLQTDFVDIGIPQDYFRFCRWIESGKVGNL